MHGLYDIKVSLQRIYREYEYSAVIIATMSLTLGIALFLFTMIYTVQYKPLPNVNSSDKIAWGTLQANGDTFVLGGLSHHVYTYLTQHQTTLDNFGRVEKRGVTLSNAKMTEQTSGAAVSPSMFQLLGVNAFRGRVLLSSDDIVGEQKNIVISYNLWNLLFDKSEDVLNQVVKINGEVATIVGVMPEGFRFPANQDVWFTDAVADSGDAAHSGWNSVFGRLKPGVEIKDTKDELQKLLRQVEKEYPDQYKGKEIAVAPFTDRFSESMSYLMVILKISSISIFLMGCFSISNIIIVRNLQSAKETLIKIALGLPISRIIVSLLLETFWLCLLATVIGLWVCYLAITYFGADLLRGPYWWALEFQTPVLLTGISAATLIWISTGLIPIWMTSRQPTNMLLSSGRKGSGGNALSRVMAGFSILQIFSTFVLMVFTGVLIVGLMRLVNADYGVPRDGYLTAEVQLSGSKYSTLEQRNQYYQRFIEQAQLISGVQGVAVTSSLPGVAWGYMVSYTSTERKMEINGTYPQADEIPISNNYFDVMQMKLIDGRHFTEADKLGSEDVAIINQSMADILYPGEKAVGKQFQHDPEKDTKLVTIVGVVADVVTGNPLWYLSDASKNWRSQIYRPITQVQPEWDSNSLIVKTDKNINDIVSAIKSIARDIDSETPLYQIKSFDEFLTENEMGFRRLIIIFTPAALLSLVIAALGIYSIARRAVLQSTPDIGIMRAIGINERFIDRKYLKSTIIQLIVALIAGVIFAGTVMPKLPTNILIADINSIIFVCGGVGLGIGMLVLLAGYIPLIAAHRLTPRDAMNFMNVKLE